MWIRESKPARTRSLDTRWRTLSSLLVLLSGVTLLAHPMGNFSISHYARLVPTARGLDVFYALDLAEIPTFELTQEAKLPRNASAEDLRQVALRKMTGWAKSLEFLQGDVRLRPMLGPVEAVVAEGAAAMPVVRLTARLSVQPQGAAVIRYRDPNFPGRAGWKEVVVGHGPDLSTALTAYPADPSVMPPQATTAEVRWDASTAPAAVSTPPFGQSRRAPSASPSSDDFLAALLSRRDLPLSVAIVGLGAAVLLGAAHALSPGHGKTIVAAYLVGSRGTVQHALFLGAMVTFTHTISVFALGLATLFLSKYVLPEKIVPVLGALSGGSIVLIGASLFRRRLRSLSHASHRDHEHAHPFGTPHRHHHHDHEHSHDPAQPHLHVPEGDITLAGLVALGVSGGLVPCPSALVMLLSAISLDRTAYGLLLLVAFSVGLAAVLMAIGVAVLYAKSMVPQAEAWRSNSFLRWAPVVSAAVIVVVGVMMTGAALGLVKPPG